MKQRILSMLCVVALMLGMFVMPAYAAEAKPTLTDKVTALTENVEDLTVAEDTYIDLNGYSIAGVTVKDGATLYVSDSQTDDYTVADGIYGSVTGATGNVQAAEGYVAITEGETVSYHKADLTLTSMTLRPAVAGVYYNSAFAADEVVAANVESYGVALSVVAEPTAENLTSLCGYSVFRNFEAGEKSGTLLTGIMTEENTDFANSRNAAMAVYGRAYIKTADGYIFGATASRDLKTQVEAIDTVFGSLNAAQKSAIAQLYKTYETVMSTWNVPNIAEAAKGLLTGDVEITVPVDADDGVVANAVTVEQDGVSITIPMGALVTTDELTLTVTRKTESDSGIEAGDDQTLMPFDVHVEGVSSENTEPLTVALGKVMPENLNMGNYTVYHVEEDGTNAMELVANAEDFTAHNQFKYTLDGELTLHMASFSEVATLTENNNGWNGEADHTWYDADPNAETLYIRNADQLWSLSQIVGGMEGRIQDSFAGQTIKLLADIDLDDAEASNDENKIFYPIGYYNSDGTYERTNTAITSSFKSFEGTFDGNGNTISNFYQNTWEMKGDHNWYDATLQYYRDGMGLFGKVYGGTVKNLTVDSFSCDGEIATTGVIAAYADCGATFENIAITNCNPRVYNIGNGGIVGCAGWYANDNVDDKITFTNITVDQTNKISALWGSYDVSCGGILGQYYPTSGQSNAIANKGIHFENCHVAAIMDVNNDVCANYQYYWYRYSGMFIGTVRKNTTDDNGYTIPDLTDITATGCTYNYGDWNNYYYCELVANSIASYTHDYQFSRLTEISKEAEIQDASGNWNKTGNYVIVDEEGNTTCYHIMEDESGEIYRHYHEDSGYDEGYDVDNDGEDDLKENRQRYCMTFSQLFSGLGYGVKAIYDASDYPDLDITLGDVEASSEKFQKILENEQIETGSQLKASDIFTAKGSYSTPVYVFVSPVGDATQSTVAAQAKNGATLEDITLEFTGTGAAKIIITDYYFCTPTVVNVTVNEPGDKEKFQPVENDVIVTAGESVPLSELFTAVDSAEIVDASVSVTVDVEGVEYTADTSSWGNGAIKVTDEAVTQYVVTITDNDYCVAVQKTVAVEVRDYFTTEEKLPNTADYIYRVGNKNSIALGSLFTAKSGEEIYGDVTVVVNDKINDVKLINNTFAKDSWTTSTIDFDDSFTGIVEVTIDALGANECVLLLEVVDAKNITSASGSNGTDVVLLNNVKISSGSTVTYSNCFVYGNGFTFDVSGGLTKYVASQGWGVINLSSTATLDNLVITGDVYDSYGAYSDNDYNTAAVASLSGTIQNCWISNCAAPVMLRGSTTIKDTTLYGGTVANVIIKGGINTFENVTTVNYNDDRTIVGAGIVIHSDADEKTELILNGTLKQYNFLCETPAPTDSNAEILYDAMFDDSCAGYQFGTTPNRYVNTGIISMTESFGEGNITDNASTGYTGQTVSIKVQNVTVNGYVYTQPNTVGSVDNGYDVTNDPHKATVQGDYLPTFEFALGDQEISYDGDSDSRYLYGDANGVNALYQDGDDALTLDLSQLASVTKYGQSLTVTAVCEDSSGIALSATNGVVTLKTGGTYTLVFEAEDNIFFSASGNEVEKTVTRTYTVPLSLSVKAADIKDAVVTISPTTLEGSYVTVNFTDYKLKLEFLECISVTDYTASNTTGSVVDLSANISTAALTNSANDVWSAATVITITYTDGRVLTVNLSDFEGSSPGTKTAGIVTDDGVYFLTEGALNNKPTEEANKCTCTITSVSYKGNNGATITNDTDVSVSWPVESSSSDNCITGDTLITLADGSQKAVEDLTGEELLLVWNLETGRYEAAPIVFVDSDAETEYEVIRLVFSDGTDVEIIYEHGFFDVTTGEYVYLDAYNAADYIGHSFIKQGDLTQNAWETVELVDVVIENKVTTAYSPVTFSHLCYYVDGMLSMPGGIEGLFNIFEVDVDTMSYNTEKMAADIETYGLFTYEDFAAVIPEEAFYAFNGAWLKVAMGKGMLTWEDIERLAEQYVPLV